MARPTGTLSLKDLLAQGVLRSGEEIIIPRRSQEPIRGALLSNGHIRVGDDTYPHPSTAARETLDLKAVNGWLRWRVPRMDLRSLDEIRTALASAAEPTPDHGLNLANLGGVPFGTVLADPPWRFMNRTGKVAPEHDRLNRYDTMDWQEIAALPVQSISAENSHCYLWVPNALIQEGLHVLEEWGFTYKTMLIWAKRRKDGGPDGRGVGFYFRNTTEPILFGVRGRLRTLEAGRRQVNILESQKREHSRKPDEQYPIIESCSPGPYLEMFARYPQPGWTAWGNEASEDVVPRGKQWPAYGGNNGTD